MREGLEAVFRAEDGERPRAILVGIEDGSGETEQMPQGLPPSRARKQPGSGSRRSKKAVRRARSVWSASRSGVRMSR